MSVDLFGQRERYRVITADPPWQFDDRLPGKGRGAERHYETLNVEQIKAFAIPETEPDAVLFLWRVAAMQKEAVAVMAAWGFTLKTEMIWLKRTRHGRRWFGMGRIVRAEHEVVLIGTRGRPDILTRSVRSTFAARVGRHSEKPERFYRLVAQMYAGPYCELFARRRRDGWDSFGDQLG